MNVQIAQLCCCKSSDRVYFQTFLNTTSLFNRRDARAALFTAGLSSFKPRSPPIGSTTDPVLLDGDDPPVGLLDIGNTNRAVN